MDRKDLKKLIATILYIFGIVGIMLFFYYSATTGETNKYKEGYKQCVNQYNKDCVVYEGGPTMSGGEQYEFNRSWED